MHPCLLWMVGRVGLLAVAGTAVLSTTSSIVEGGDTLPIESEFSGILIKRVGGKNYYAQVFAKGDRLRLEYKYAIRTELGYSAIEIIRPDLGERWYLLPQLKQLLVLPITDDTLSIRAELAGETSRTSVGEATVAGRAARLFEVHVKREGIPERFYEWVDAETGIVLKLVSQDRDWSFAYERIRMSTQPNQYFAEPPGYRKRRGGTD